MSDARLQRIAAPDFDLAATLNCGQVFHWEALGSGFVGMIGEVPIYAEQKGDRLSVPHGCSALARRYFALDHPLQDICASFPHDETMAVASDFCRGLRLIRQPKWECLAMFICSSMKQVAHIRQMARALRKRFGTPAEIDANRLFAFPSAARLADATEAELRECGLGYRAKNLLGTARRVSSGAANLEAWTRLPDADLRTQLCDLPGVGVKVANCVMLFAYERTRAFPIDVWIARVLRERYFARKRKPTDRRLREFAAEYFGEHGGYAQQYLFHHARMTTKRTRTPPGPSTSLRSARDDEQVARGTNSPKSGKVRA